MLPHGARFHPPPGSIVVMRSTEEVGYRVIAHGSVIDVVWEPYLDDRTLRWRVQGAASDRVARSLATPAAGDAPRLRYEVQSIGGDGSLSVGTVALGRPEAPNHGTPHAPQNVDIMRPAVERARWLFGMIDEETARIEPALSANQRQVRLRFLLRVAWCESAQLTYRRSHDDGHAAIGLLGLTPLHAKARNGTASAHLRGRLRSVPRRCGAGDRIRGLRHGRVRAVVARPAQGEAARRGARLRLDGQGPDRDPRGVRRR